MRGQVNMIKVEIHVKERLDSNWAEWFEGFTITYDSEGNSILNGSVQDQAALYGMMAKLRDLGITLNSVHIKQ
jgi:hypothetical protein